MRDKPFIDPIAGDTDANGTINWNNVVSDDAMLARFGDDAAKIRQLLVDQGPVNLGLSDLRYLLNNATSVALKEMSINLGDGFNPHDIIGQLIDIEAENQTAKAIALVFTCNPEKPVLTLSTIMQFEDFFSRNHWAVQYNDTIPVDTINITMIITQ